MPWPEEMEEMARRQMERDKVKGMNSETKGEKAKETYKNLDAIGQSLCNAIRTFYQLNAILPKVKKICEKMPQSEDYSKLRLSLEELTRVEQDLAGSLENIIKKDVYKAKVNYPDGLRDTAGRLFEEDIEKFNEKFESIK